MSTLGKRLSAIAAQVNLERYAHVWDCCCDHGQLGEALISQDPRACVHFVDTVPALTDAIAQRLREHGSDPRHQVHCLDAAKLPLSHYAGPHLVIIAGVGGSLTRELISALSRRASDHPHRLEFLLCPVHQQHEVRQALNQQRFGLVHEVLIEERKRFYELIHAAPAAPLATSPKEQHTKAFMPMSLIGETLWQVQSEAHRQQLKRYQQQKINHYQRQQRADHSPLSAQLLQAYQRIVL